MANSTLPRIVSVASAIGWLLGSILVLVGIAGSTAASWTVALPFIFGAAYCTAGFLLMAGRRAGALTGIIAASMFVSLILIGSRGSITGIAMINLGFLLLCIAALRALVSVSNNTKGGPAMRPTGM